MDYMDYMDYIGYDSCLNTDIKSYLNFVRDFPYDLDEISDTKVKTLKSEEIKFVRLYAIFHKSLSHDIAREDFIRMNNVDIKKLEYKNRHTSQEERLELLFFLENGIINLEMMKKHNIAYTFLRKLAEKWEIKKPVKGIYMIKKLCNIYVKNILDIDNVAYAISAKDNIVVDSNYFKPTFYINSNYRGKKPKCSNIIYVNKNELMVDTSFYPINNDLGYMKTNICRRFCELVRQMTKENYNSLVDICDSENTEYLYDIVSTYNMVKGDGYVYDPQENEDTSSNFNKEKLRNVAKKLNMENEVMDMYVFLTVFYRRRDSIDEIKDRSVINSIIN